MLNPCDTHFVERLTDVLPEGTIREAGPAYLEEPRGIWRGHAGAVALPATVGEVSVIVGLAAQARVGIVPWSGGTGLVGGQIMTGGPAPLVLSLERMRRVRAVHPDENLMVCEAGVTLAEAQEAAEAAGRLYPLSLASEGSCRVGGNLSTNAGGVQMLRYGNARELCLGLEAVMPDGTIWHGLKRLRKDNTGYDLRNLLIGAEGTLGIITAAVLRLSPRMVRNGTALLVVPDPAAALRLLSLAREIIGESVSAFELISGVGLGFISETLPDLRQPWPEAPDWAVLIEVGTESDRDPQALIEALFMAGNEAGMVLDGMIAGSQAQSQAFWALRESMSEANRRIGAILSNDISLPLGRIAGFIDEARTAIAALGPLRINCFGHLGDGNLHFNIFPEPGGTRAAWADRRETLMRLVNDLVAAHEGSFSAEHGVGRAKVGELERYGDPAKLAAMRAIKAALDPLGIMNPGAVLRA
ncbi:FAD-binding oxidoreductase [Frigidibacter sp. ROC022]|uniref:FAD-binding oxidoreductase n=1 Tax=Frigidibacter sp. ROC022 TaxID=2971796 RepID=UPI00215A3037|nr:FAD-binding oxidoreductase [Frigidibacter sp. ROC022]MCR8723977.1 FAD-binding oxidoreductase [Frigidibacter sp. ROC022]